MFTGGLVGGGLMLALLAGPLAKRPVQIIDSSTYKTQARVHDGYLEVHVKLLRTEQCNSASQVWIWRYDQGDGLFTKAKFWVPVEVNLITLADASPVIQDIIVAHVLPPWVTPGQWFVKIKYVDYCRLFTSIFGPTMRESSNIPLTVPVGWSTARAGGGP